MLSSFLEATVFSSKCNLKLHVALLATLAAFSIFASGIPPACAQTFASLDAPGAGTGQGQGTFPLAINSSGVIVGYFTDSSDVEHGFIRAADGTFTTVDDPPGTYTQLTAINSLGIAAGNGTNDLGFVWYRSGTLGPLYVPLAKCVIPVGMNDAGQIAGVACLDFPIERGFLWSHGKSTVFKVPGAGSYVGVKGLNASGMIAGTYNDALDQRNTYAFLRDSAGNVTGFSATSSTKYTFAVGLNSSGQVAGYYSAGSDNGVQSFVRNTDGTITLLTLAGYYQVQAAGINDDGVVVGTAYTDTSATAFETDTAGNVNLIVFPFNNVGVTGIAVNNSGQVIGHYYDSANVEHGWLMIP
jgi:hypothetical protein